MQRVLGGMLGWAAGFACAAGPNYSIDLDDVPALRSPLSAIVLNAPSAAAARPAPSEPAGPAPRMAVLLPLSGALAEAAQVLRQGIEAGWKVDGDAELTWYDSAPDPVAAYRQALADGATVVIGPLAREEIAAVAPMASAPTLVLNTPPASAPPTVYAFSLSAEADGGQLVQVMRQAGHLFPLMVVGQDAVASRLAQAWRDAWGELAGRRPNWLLRWPADRERMIDLAASADSVALAVPSAAWPALQPLLGSLPVYVAPSLNDLPRARLAWPGLIQLDQPWVLAPQAAQVARYPRPAEPLTLATERLYAQGIDAFRLARRLAGRSTPGLALDGVTGWLQLRGRDVQRVLQVQADE